MDGQLTIREATPADRAAAERVLLDCERHYWGQRDGDEATTRETAAALLEGRSGCTLMLAFAPEPVGFATWTLLHPAPTPAGTVFLKDLYVTAAARGTGTGEALLRAVAGIAAARGCARFDWTAEDDNPRAVAFYDRLGAERVDEKLYFRFSGEAIARFADG